MASSAQISIDLKEYLLATRVMSIRWSRFAVGDVSDFSSGGLKGGHR